MGGGSEPAGGGGSQEGSRVERSCNDGEGLGTSREVMEGISEGEGSLDAECAEDKVEQETTWCQESMNSVLNTAAKKIKI